MAGRALRLWEVRGWGAYQRPATPGQQMTFVKDYFHGAEGVFGSWGNGGVKRFFHNDHLGSPRLIPGDDGANPLATLATRYYYPYGTDFGSGSTHDDRISKLTSHEGGDSPPVEQHFDVFACRNGNLMLEVADPPGTAPRGL